MKLSKFTLYIGLNDKVSKIQEIDTLTAYKIITREVLNSGLDGCTIKECKGIYTHDSGDVVIESTLEVILLFATKDQVESLCDKIKVLLNQESIAIQKELVESSLY